MSESIHVSTHPLVKHHLARLRDVATPSDEFRRLVRSLTQLIAHDATADLETSGVEVTTPMARARGEALACRVAIVPILRAGLAMADTMIELLPSAEVWHVGLYRDEATLQPHAYYSRLPTNAKADVALLVDPMLATGGSALHACRLLADAGVKRIKLLCLIAASEGVGRLSGAMPNVAIYTGALDERLNEVGYIVPGLGDAGDRLYGTTPAGG